MKVVRSRDAVASGSRASGVGAARMPLRYVATASARAGQAVTRELMRCVEGVS